MRTAFKVVVLLVFALTSAPAQSTLTVPSPTHPTIQSAIDAAGYFDTILVAAGTYHESLNIHHKHLTIEGAGPTATIIDSDGLDRCIRVEQQVGGTTTIRQLALREGIVGGPGGGIYAKYSNTVGLWTLALEDVVIEDCKAVEGNGLFAAGHVEVEMTDSIIRDNLPIGLPHNGPEARGGGIFVANADLTLLRCRVENNRSWRPSGSGYGGGIYVLDGNLTADDSTIRGNSATGLGGGIDAKSDFKVELTRCVIAENVANGLVPALYLHNGDQSLNYNGMRVFLDGCLIAGNHSAVLGPPSRTMYLDAAVIDIRNTTIAGNGLPGEDLTPLFATRWIGTLFTSYFHLENSIVCGNIRDRVFCQSLPSKTVLRSLVGSSIDVLPPGSVTLAEVLTGLDAAYAAPGQGDFRLRPGSPCVDKGMTVIGSPTVDLEGLPRLVGPAQDMGCFELQNRDPGPAFAGTTSSNDLIVFNGTSGGTTRTVTVDAGSTCSLAVASPVPNTPAPFILWGYLGVPGPADRFPIPFAGGSMAFLPHLLDMGNPRLFTFSNNLLEPNSGLLFSTPAPWSVTGPASPFPITMTIQGLIADGPGALRLTNAMTLHAR